MSEFFSKMDADYVQKHFPDGSVFESAMKTLKRRSVGGIFFFGLFSVGALYALVWTIGRTLELQSNGKKDMLGFSIGICVFFGLILLGSLAVLRILIKARGKKHSDYIADSAKNSKLSVSEIETFERQAVASDCYILKLTAGLDRALSNATNKDGLLTRDYVYLADPAQTVIRVDSLKACCFSDYTYYLNVGRSTKKIHNLVICLIASNGVSVLSDTTEKAGLALMELLKERNNAIDTNEGKVLPEGAAFDEYKKRILEE